MFLLGTATVAQAALNPQVTLAWDSPTNFPAAGYKIYYGYASHTYTMSIDVGTATVYTVTGLDDTSTYYFAVTAYNNTNGESTYSSELGWSVNDQDNDGMADLWESLYFDGTQTTNGAGTMDCDHDGVCNLEEYILGSNPTNANTFENVDVAFAGGQFEASFTALAATGLGYAGKTRYYTLEQCTNLAAGTWAAVPGYVAMVASNQPVLYATSASGAATFRTRVWLQ